MKVQWLKRCDNSKKCKDDCSNINSVNHVNSSSQKCRQNLSHLLSLILILTVRPCLSWIWTLLFGGRIFFYLTCSILESMGGLNSCSDFYFLKSFCSVERLSCSPLTTGKRFVRMLHLLFFISLCEA